jgi:predicted RNA-binding protein with PUA-like domain
MYYWLLKTEPTSYSIDDLKREKKTAWSGVRNYQARNNMRAMKKGDLVLIHHSSTAAPAVVGVGKVAKEYYPDPTQFDQKDSHYDPKSTKEKPMWGLVDVAFVKKLPKEITLTELKKDKFFNDMALTQRGSRLSVQPVLEKHFKKIVGQK